MCRYKQQSHVFACHNKTLVKGDEESGGTKGVEVKE